MAFDITFWKVTAIALGVFLGAGGLAIGIAALVRWMVSKDQGYPGEAEIEEALRKWAGLAIIAAFKVSEAAVDEFKRRLDGLDKKEIADKLYDLLPDSISIGKFQVPVSWVKRFVTRERFDELVQEVYDEAMAKLDELIEWGEGQLDGFLEP